MFLLEILSEDASSNGYYVSVYPRYADTNNRVMLYILPNKVTLSLLSGGTYSVLDEDTRVTTSQDTWYDYRVLCGGANIEVWRSTVTAMPTKVLEIASCSVTSTANVGAAIAALGHVVGGYHGACDSAHALGVRAEGMETTSIHSAASPQPNNSGGSGIGSRVPQKMEMGCIGSARSFVSRGLLALALDNCDENST